MNINATGHCIYCGGGGGAVCLVSFLLYGENTLFIFLNQLFLHHRACKGGMAYAQNISTHTHTHTIIPKLELLMFFEFSIINVVMVCIFYSMIFREEGIMNIIHYILRVF